MENLDSYTLSPGIVNIQSNVNHIHHFFLGEDLDCYPKHAEAKVNVGFKITGDINCASKTCQKFDCCYWDEQAGTLYYERPLIGKVKLKLQIANVLGSPKISVNSIYHRLIKWRIESLLPPGVYLTDVVVIQLLQNGFVPLHSACFDRDGEAFLLFAPPNTGKSMTMLSLLKLGYNYVAEDIAIADTAHVYSCPATSTITIPTNKRAIALSLYNLIHSRFPALSHVLYPHLFKIPRQSILKALPNTSIKEKSTTRVICLLELGGEDRIEQGDKETILRKLLILNRNEFSYYKNPLLMLYSYVNPDFKLNRLMEREEEMLSLIVSNSESFVLTCRRPEDFAELVSKIVQNDK